MQRFGLKGVLLGGVFAAFSASSVPAADLPPAPVYVPIYNWTGFYLGVHAGYGWATTDESFFDVEEEGDGDGFIAGGQLGYNYQFDSLLIGFEADLSWFGLNEDDEGPFEISVEADWLATIRGRIGYAFDRLLFYATGGLAISDIGLEVDLDDDDDVVVADHDGFKDDFKDDDDDDVKIGWTIGVGIEGMITPNLTAKLEYLYLNFSDDNFFDEDVDIDAHLIRAGLNYKFTW